ncbi:hypothetical protein ACQRIT_003623 [Beauveria bassiana]
MAEEEGSSSVGADGLYSKAAYVDTPAIPDYQTLHDNTPAVQQIRDLYSHNRWVFTKWHMALFYMTSKDHLADLAENPEAAREYGDGAQLFCSLFNLGRIPATYKLRARAAVNLAPPSASITFDVSAGSSTSRNIPPATHKRRKFEDIEKRDRQGCVVTHKAKPFDGAHIVPFAVNSTEAGLAYLPPALAIAERLLGKSFGEEIREDLDTLGGSDYPFNIITLTPYLHRLWDTYGLIGFRPCYIDAKQDESGKAIYFATFTFHWLFKNALREDVLIMKKLSAHDCCMMVNESTEFTAEKNRYFETVYTPGRDPPNDIQRLQDGHVCRVEFEDRRLAERMMVMLDLRWHASRLLCLSGGAGDDFLKLDPSADDSDSDGYLVFEESASRGVWGSHY